MKAYGEHFTIKSLYTHSVLLSFYPSYPLESLYHDTKSKSSNVSLCNVTYKTQKKLLKLKFHQNFTSATISFNSQTCMHVPLSKIMLLMVCFGWVPDFSQLSSNQYQIFLVLAWENYSLPGKRSEYTFYMNKVF